MPIHLRDDGKPVVEFDPLLELSPFTLFRRLREDQALRLIDVRADPKGMTLEGSIRLPGPDWEPDQDTPVVLFDDTGTEAVELARSLQARGHETVRALFGGLELYEFSLDPEVVGRETYLKPVAAAYPTP
jgi:rhodanese-related sulfurtransferase